MDSQLILKIRKETLGLSQKAFAEEMGVDQSTVSNWETNGLPNRSMIRETLERRLRALVKRKRKQFPATEGQAA